MSETTKVDPIDEAAARALEAAVAEPQSWMKRARLVRLAILRGMLERELSDKMWSAVPVWLTTRECKDVWRAMLSAEIDQLEKESP